jgi:hypothetical protein
MIKVPVIITVANKGLKQADSALKTLNKGFKKLGLTSKLSVAAAVSGITLLSKKSLAAAIAQEKANRSLQQTLKNIGQEKATKSVIAFTDALQRSSGVNEDKLQPALQRLLNVTENVSAAQELLKRALDISAGSGNSLETVVNALGKAYSGSTGALGKLNLGLDKSLLASGDLNAIMGELQQKFGGQTQVAAETLAGQLDKLKIAAGEATEEFGKKLVVAISQFNADGSKSLDGLGRNMETFGERAGNAVIGVGALVNDLKIGLGVLNAESNGFFGKLTQALSPLAIAFRYLEERGKATAEALELAAAIEAGRSDTKGLAMNKQKVDLEKAYIAALMTGVDIDELLIFNATQQAKLAAKQIKDAAAKAKIDKQALAYKRLALKFDEQNIQIQAALKGKLSEDDKKRLLALQALKTETNADDMTALIELEAAQKKAADAEIEQRKKIATSQAQAIAEQKAQVTAYQDWLSSNPLRFYTTFTGSAGQTITAPTDLGVPGTVQKRSTAPTILLPQNDSVASNPPPTNASLIPPSAAQQNAILGQAPNVTVNVNAGTIADENKLTYIIADQIVKYVRFGGTTAPAGFI